MAVLVFVTVLVLAVIAGLHLLWALGIWFPGGDEAQLARRVTGFAGATRMPPKPASLFVAVALVVACHILEVGAGRAEPILPAGLYDLALWGLVAVFCGRGLAAWTAPWRRLTPEEPFATMDRRYFGPLCLAIGVVFLSVAI